MRKSEIIKKLDQKLADRFAQKDELKASELDDFTLVDHILLFVYSTDKTASWSLGRKIPGTKLIVEGNYQSEDWTLVRRNQR